MVINYDRRPVAWSDEWKRYIMMNYDTSYTLLDFWIHQYMNHNTSKLDAIKQILREWESESGLTVKSIVPDWMDASNAYHEIRRYAHNLAPFLEYATDREEYIGYLAGMYEV